MILGFHIIWTVLLFIIFVGIVYWAYSKSSDDRFDAAAQIPFEDEQLAESSAKAQRAENKHE